VVLGSTPRVQLTRRAESTLAVSQAELAPLADSDGTVVVRDPAGDLRWWTWAGAGANGTLHATLPGLVDPLQRVDNLSLRLRRDLTMAELRTAVRAAQDRPLAAPAINDEALPGLKFSTALPRSIAADALGLADPDGAATVLREPALATHGVPYRSRTSE
jgi:ATP-dependent helicase Lhr and Lhr-like helicase